MTKYTIKHHQIIESALSNFNADFFCENNIVFGGGTRIALELDEFRESIDIDFLCPNKSSYRAVREQVDNVSLGELVKKEFTYLRDIRADRDAVRTVIQHEEANIKLEFVSFDNYELVSVIDKEKFVVPFLDQTSCYYTKLLANADRKLTPPYKDIIDILAMYSMWGSIPQMAFTHASSHYGEKQIKSSLAEALKDIVSNPEKYREAARNVKMKSSWISPIVDDLPKKLLSEI